MDDFLLTSASEDGSAEAMARSHHGPTIKETRRFKDVLKGNYRRTQSTESSTSSSLTLLQYFFATLVHIYEASFPDPTSSLSLLCVRAVKGIFQWTSMDHLGDSAVQRCLELMLYTVCNFTFHPPLQKDDGHNNQMTIRLDVYKATLQALKEWVISCHTANSLPTPCDGASLPSYISSSSSIQSISDPKLPILCNLMKCFQEISLLPSLAVTSATLSHGALNGHALHGSSLIDDDNSVDAEAMEALIELATLVNSIGLELLPLYEQHVLSSVSVKHEALEQLFFLVMDLFFRLFAYDDIDVATAVLPFATQLSFYMEEGEHFQNGTNHVASSMAQHLPLMLSTLYNQMMYPIDFSYNYDDEDDAEEEVFRTELCQVYKKLIRSAPAVCLQFVSEILLSQCSIQNVADVATPEIEASLRFLFHYCEAIRPAPGLKVVMKNESFCTILRTLHNSNIAHHPHREVLSLYYETAVRYYPIYLTDPELLARLLSAMTGPTGLQHDHPRVRSRCCYLLLRLVKATISLLRPYVETAVTGIESLLLNRTLDLRTEDTLFLFETIGLLLGQSGLEVSQQQQWITAVITPHVHSMEHHILILMNRTLPIEDVEDQNGEVLSNSIAAITNLSKGFTNPATEVASVLIGTLDISLRVLQALPHSEPVRNKTMVLLQRMIVCVGKNVLVSMPAFLHPLILHCTNDDILFVSQLFNQLSIKFKDDAVSVIDAMLLPFLQKCEALTHACQVAVGDTAEHIPPHIVTEQLAVRKLVFVVLQHIVSYKVTAVLFSTTNANHLESILQIMNEGISNNDFIVQKTCVRFFRVLLEQLESIPTVNGSSSMETSHYRQGTLQFICQMVISNIFHSLLRNSSLVLRDANGGRVISELGQLLHTLNKTCTINRNDQQEYQNCLTLLLQRLFPGGTEVDLATLQGPTATVNDIVICLNQLLKSYKKGTLK